MSCAPREYSDIHLTFPSFAAGLLSSQKLPVGGPLASRSSNRETLVSTLAKAVGARTLASPELLAHFIRAGGGDVDKAVALYLSIVEEFVEFRDMAR